MKIWLAFFLIVFSLQLSNAQVLERDRDGSSSVFGDDPDVNPFSEGADTLGNEPVDSNANIIMQNTDTINYEKIVRRFDLNLERHIPELSLDKAANYQPVWSLDQPAVNLGNNGLPIYQLSPDVSYSPTFNAGFHSMDAYKIKDEDVGYYRAQRPYSKLHYVTGTKRENDFTIEFTQNLGRGLNLGAEYRSLVSFGFYDNQEINHKNIAVHAWFQSKNKHFNSMAHYINNKYLIGINGGIVPGVDYFSIVDYKQRETIPVNLPTGEKKYKDHRAHWQNSYDFGKTVKVKINDSISDIQIVPRFRVQHTFSLDDQFNYFTSLRSENDYFGQAYYPDSIATADSIVTNVISNEFRMKWLGNKLGDSSTLVRQNFLADAYARFSLVDVTMREGYADQLSDLVVGGSFRSNPLDSTQSIIYKAEGAYHILDYRQNDYYLRGEAGFNLNTAGQLVGFAEWNNQAQEYVANHFWQSHYHFNNDFGKVNARSLGAKYHHPKLNLNAQGRFVNVSNFYYVKAMGDQAITSSAESFAQLNLTKDFEIRKFHWLISATYQASSNNEAIRVPDWIASSQFYYTGPLFRNKVTAKIGFDGWWHSKMYLDYYNPSLDQFVRQNEREYKNDPQLNFFSSFSLSRARTFLRLDNLNDLIRPEKPIYQADLFPQHKFAFRVGIDWVFVN